MAEQNMRLDADEQVFFDNQLALVKSRTYDVQHAVCLEAQNWPDSINHAAFPNIILRPGEKLDEITEYRFL